MPNKSFGIKIPRCALPERYMQAIKKQICKNIKLNDKKNWIVLSISLAVVFVDSNYNSGDTSLLWR
tara:strand:- start:257 stop:454 length:198 start_codon:yes stop_codon:yes gene_type:complete